MSVLSVTIVKQGEQDIPGLTDTTVPKRLGPKRASNIRKFFVCIAVRFSVYLWGIRNQHQSSHSGN
jgi:hypothetical protein